MPALTIKVNEPKAIERLMRFLAVEGVTGQEKMIGQEVIRALLEAGVPRRNIKYDKANERIPLPTQTGNLIVHLPGTKRGPRRLFMTHLDTVPLCAGAKPVLHGRRIKPAGKTALGATIGRASRPWLRWRRRYWKKTCLTGR
jgi:tripeptide aminopeptidase